jgi:YgiT-type zinc finger domain-containing protein
MMKTCIECRGTDFTAVVVSEKRTVDGVIYADTVPAQECTQCGEQYFAYLDLHAQSRRLAAELEKLATPGPEAAEFLRKWKLGIEKIAEDKAAYEAEQTSSCKM